MFRYIPLLVGVKLYSSSVTETVNDLVIVDKYNKIKESYRTPKYPIVLCHGLSGFDRLVIIPPLVTLSPFSDKGSISEEQQKRLISEGISFDYWRGIKDALELNGCTVVVAKVPPFGSIEERALALNECIESKIKNLKRRKDGDPDRIYNEQNKANETDSDKIKINLIAHSMGGLDSRYLISKIEQEHYEVMSLTTIATPHHGSYMLNYVTSEMFSGGVKKIIPRSIYELTIGALKEFNESVKDDPKVKYFSYGAEFHPVLANVFYLPWKVIYDFEGDNDGMVSVKSAHWGKYLGTLKDVDHLDSINWTNTIKNFWSLNILKKPPNFNAVLFYLDIVDQLAAEGL